MTRACWIAAAAVACGGAAPGVDESNPLQGVAALVRDVVGARVPTAELAGGGGASDPDASGHLVFNDELPGLFGVTAEAPGYVRTGTGAPVVLNQLSAAELWIAEGNLIAGAETIELPGATLTLAPDSLVDRDFVPFDGPWELMYLFPEGEERWASPGDGTLVYNDVQEKPIELSHPLYLQGSADEVGLRLDEDAVLTYTLPPGSPVQSDWAVYHYSMGSHRWSGGRRVTLEDGRVTVLVPSFGWIAFGVEDSPRGCVTGTLSTTYGQAAVGAEIRLLEEGGVQTAARAYVDETGGFCLPLGVGAKAEVKALWYNSLHTEMGAYQGSVTHGGSGAAGCGGVCENVGTLTLESGQDVDGDFYFGGPGGDCDDGDDSVNPSIVYGDGSWCAGL